MYHRSGLRPTEGKRSGKFGKSQHLMGNGMYVEGEIPTEMYFSEYFLKDTQTIRLFTESFTPNAAANYLVYNFIYKIDHNLIYKIHKKRKIKLFQSNLI